MGLGIGVNCKICEDQLSYEDNQMDEEKRLCGGCIADIKLAVYLAENPEEAKKVAQQYK